MSGRAQLLTLTEADVFRFWAHVVIGEPHECWPWRANTGKVYPVFRLYRDGRVYYFGAHVVALVLKLGHDDFPVAEHMCDSKRCVNPMHLCPGDQSSNGLASHRQQRWEKERFFKPRQTSQLVVSPSLLTL